MADKIQPFSERYGYRKAKKEIQIESINQDLRVALWNAIYEHYFKVLRYSNAYYRDDDAQELVRRIWADYFEYQLDELPPNADEILEVIKNYFFGAEWYDVYDFVQFTANYYPGQSYNHKFKAYCNEVLERKVAGYRFVGDVILENTSPQQIEQIEKATNSPLAATNKRLTTALQLLSDKREPNYRDSINNSIGAVEAMCQEITGTKMTLGQTLGVLSNAGVEIPGRLREAFEKFYGWASSDKGTRHGNNEEWPHDFEDAMFMLVACSAFVNYLVEKANKAGKLKTS